MPDTKDKIPHRKEVILIVVSKHQMLEIMEDFYLEVLELSQKCYLMVTRLQSSRACLSRPMHIFSYSNIRY